VLLRICGVTSIVPRMILICCQKWQEIVVIFMQINKCLIMHLGRTIFFLVVLSCHIRWEMFSSLQSCHPPWEKSYWKAEGKRIPSEEREIYRSFCCYCENWRIWHRFRHHVCCYGIIFDNLMYPILKIESAKIMCFLKFSIAKIRPKFTKKHQIFIVGSSR
jgi:hypothetical protein